MGASAGLVSALLIVYHHQSVVARRLLRHPSAVDRGRRLLAALAPLALQLNHWHWTWSEIQPCVAAGGQPP